MNVTMYQCVQKLLVVDEQSSRVLLCQRRGEADLDGIFTLIGGKLEHGDEDLVAGLRREKDEEVGAAVRLSVLTTYATFAEFTKADGSKQILPHYYAVYRGGDIEISEEYASFQWVAVDELNGFGPIVPNIPMIADRLIRLRRVATDDDFIEM
jgi:8-oxo-dGTP pyrophosphatase MutT (NUDIX family)